MIRIDNYNHFNTCIYEDKSKDLLVEFWQKTDESKMFIDLEQGIPSIAGNKMNFSLERDEAIDLVSFMMKEFKITEDEMIISQIN